MEIRVDKLIQAGILPAPFRVMSHGIGEGYLKRMKRYHVPSNIRSPTERVSLICDRSFYPDGTFRYKLPRYYRDRLYRKKFPFDANVWNKKLNCYESKIVYRYASKNMLSRQMQIEIRNRLLAEYNRQFSELRSINPNLSDTEIHLLVERSSVSARQVRRDDIYTKLSRFYNFNRFKNRKF